MNSSHRPILLDAHALGSELGGNERYIRGLLEGFAALGQQNLLSLALDEAQAATGDPLLRGWRIESLGRGRSRADRLFLRFPQLMAEGRHSLLHVTAVSPPMMTHRSIVTIHDILFEDHPSYFPWQQVLAFKLAFRLSAMGARRIITISNFTAQRLMEVYRVPPQQISVTPLAVGAEFHPEPPERIASVCEKFGIRGKYLLAVGNLHPRKNLHRLGLAFRDLITSGKLDGLSLVLVGKKTWRAEKVLDPLTSLLDQGRVILTGYVEDADLPALYSGAQAFIYPSLFEGFGIPPLEAMACGTPAIVGYTSSLPEVCGDAACWVDPWSVGDLKTALTRISECDDYRIALAQAGLERAKTFTWERTAKKTAEAYDLALGS